MYDNKYLEPRISSISNDRPGNCYYCLNENNFNTEIYPKLTDIKQRGTEVICIGSDIGLHVNEFEYLTNEGIHFLASGINAGNEDNKALLFNHDITNKSLTWEFRLISSL